MDNKYVLGLDIGISSCGYGIIDLETGKFVDYGVRLFSNIKLSPGFSALILS